MHVKVQKYYCKKCGKYSQTEFSEDYDAYSHFHKDILLKTIETKELENVSLRNISKFHKIYNNIDKLGFIHQKCIFHGTVQN